MNYYDFNTRPMIKNRHADIHNRRFNLHKLMFTIVGVIVAIVFIGSIGFMVATGASAQSPETVTCTVSSKERVTEVVDGNSQTRLLINTEDCGTLEIGSAMFSGNWSPNSTYSSIKEGNIYNFEVYGFNIDVMNQFKQVKSFEQVR